MLQLVRVVDELPAGFDALQAEAEAEGHRNLTRLAVEWAAHPAGFIAVLGALDEGVLVGIGALTPEPAPASEPALRIRRLYVARRVRRRGVARTLVNALLQEALGEVRLVTVNAHPASVGFWEALHFAPVPDQPWTHTFSAA